MEDILLNISFDYYIGACYILPQIKQNQSIALTEDVHSVVKKTEKKISD